MAFVKKPEHFWPALWLGVIAILAGVVALEFYFGRESPGPGARAPAKIVEARLLPAFTLPPEEELAPETAARPLFVPTRRPAPVAAAAAASTMKRGQFALTGVTVTPDASFAFLRETSTGKTHSIRKGAQLNGLTVELVEPRRVVLKQGEESEELALNIMAPARVAGAPVSTAGVHRAPGQVAGPGVVPVQFGAGLPAAQGKDAASRGTSPAPPAPIPGVTLPGFPAVPANTSDVSAERARRRSLLNAN